MCKTIPNPEKSMDKINPYIKSIIDSVPCETFMPYPVTIKGSKIAGFLGITDKKTAKTTEIFEIIDSSDVVYLKLYFICVLVRKKIEETIDAKHHKKHKKIQLKLYDGTLIYTSVGSIDSYTSAFFNLLYDSTTFTDKKDSTPVTDTDKKDSTTFTDKKYERFLRLFSTFFYECKWFKDHKKPYNGITVNNPDDLFLLLRFAGKLGNIEWSDIDPDSQNVDAEKLCMYLFDISSYDLDDNRRYKTLDKLSKEWSGITFDLNKISNINNLCKEYAAPIMKEALKHPLFRYYFSADKINSSGAETATPLTHINEVRELLKRTARVKDNIIVIDSPITAVTRYVKEKALELCREQEYTVHDFLYAAGWVAEKAASQKEYYAEDAINSLLNDGLIELNEDTRKKIVETLKVQNFLISDVGEHKKFRIRSYRLVCAAFYAACSLNKMSVSTDDQKNIFENKLREYLHPYLKRYLEHIGDSDLVRLGDDFYNNCDAAAFYAVSLISYLNYEHRNIITSSFCEKEASDFSIVNRPTQEIFIYILVNVLCTYDIEISTETRKLIFESTFGKTLYSYQISQWEYINGTSNFYSEEVRRSTEDSLKIKIIDGETFAEKPPIYTFICGKRKREQSDKKNFWEKASAAPFSSFVDKLSSTTIKSTIKSLLEEAVKKLITYDITSDNLEYAYGVHMAAYAMSNLKINHPETKFNEFIDSNAGWEKYSIFELFIKADYITRASSEEYNKENTDYSSLFLLCGVTRVVCAYELEKEEKKVVLGKNAAIRYSKWLSKELQDKNIRYAMLLSRILECTDFYTNKDYRYDERGNKLPDLPDLKEIITRQSTLFPEKQMSVLLPYDNFSDYID